MGLFGRRKAAQETAWRPDGIGVDGKGNVYVANGQIFVYSPAGKQIAQIDVPERPLQLVFGGADRKTLYILAHHALFAATVR